MERIKEILFADIYFDGKLWQAAAAILVLIFLSSLTTCGVTSCAARKNNQVTQQEECRNQAKEYMAQANSYLTSGTVITVSTFPVHLNCPVIYDMIKVTEELVNKKVSKEFDYEAKRKLMQEELEQHKALERQLAADFAKAVSILQRVPNR